MRRTRRGRPSLIGTAARTAVIAGTATAVSGAVSETVVEPGTVVTAQFSETGGLTGSGGWPLCWAFWRSSPWFPL